MHELSIVFQIAKEVEQIALENNVKRVHSVTLDIGEVSMVVSPYLLDCWKWNCTKHELLHDCALIINDIKAITVCLDCGTEYETLKYAKICPACHSENTVL